MIPKFELNTKKKNYSNSRFRHLNIKRVFFAMNYTFEEIQKIDCKTIKYNVENATPES
jgi:hypothetical protein